MLNSSDIEKIIPHRFPFLLIDRVDELEVGIRAKGVKCVTAHSFSAIFRMNISCRAF